MKMAMLAVVDYYAGYKDALPTAYDQYFHYDVWVLFVTFVIVVHLSISLYQIIKHALRIASWEVILDVRAQSWIISAWSSSFILLRLTSRDCVDEHCVDSCVLIACASLGCLVLHSCVSKLTSTEDEELDNHDDESDYEIEKGLSSGLVTDEICSLHFPPKYFNSQESFPQDSKTEPLLQN